MQTDSPSAPTTSQDIDLRRVAMMALALTLPIEVLSAVARADGLAPGYSRITALMIFDPALALLAVLAIPDVLRRIRSRNVGLGLVTGLVLTAAALFALFFHPTARGLYVVGRLAATALVAGEIGRLTLSEVRQWLVGPLLIAGSIQGILALAQTINGGPLGVGFGEQAELYMFGSVTAGSGTMAHPYVLAALAAVIVTVGIALAPSRPTPMPWLVGIGLTAISLGVTFSRSAAAGLVFSAVAIGIAVMREPGRYGRPAAAALAGAALAAVIFAGGWLDRIDQSTTTDVEALSSRRVTHIEQALDVVSSSPLVGVGPGQYAIVLEAEHNPEIPDTVHFVPLLVAAEDGVVAGLAFVVLMTLLAVRAWRTSPAAFAVVASLAGFMAFDKLTYLHPNGLVMFAIWLGILDLLAATPAHEPAVANAAS